MRTWLGLAVREQREPSSLSGPMPASSSALMEVAVPLAGLHSSTTPRPSTKHSGTVLPALSGTQSSSRESLQRSPPNLAVLSVRISCRHHKP